MQINKDITMFKELRENIESLIIETQPWIKQKSINESSIRTEELRKLLLKLNGIVANETQKRSVFRLKQEIDILDVQVENIYSKREAGKKQDGNIAFKCNWNDKNYRAPCSEEAYNSNLIEGRSWCNHQSGACRNYSDEVTLEKNPCYESIALKEMYFGAGWDTSGPVIKYRKLHSVKTKRLAILTTRRPFTDENDRIIVGVLYINRIIDDDGAETKIFGDKGKSMAIDLDKTNLKFWDYYKNPNAEDKIFWGAGLVRYISNGTVLGILNDMNKKFSRNGTDNNIVNQLINHYECLKG